MAKERDKVELMRDLGTYQDEVILKYNLTALELQIIEYKYYNPKVKQYQIAKELGVAPGYISLVLRKPKIVNAMIDIGKQFMGSFVPEAMNVIVGNMRDEDRNLAHKAAIDTLNISGIATKHIVVENKESVVDRVSKMTPDEAVVFLRRIMDEAETKQELSIPQDIQDADFAEVLSGETDSELSLENPKRHKTESQADDSAALVESNTIRNAGFAQDNEYTADTPTDAPRLKDEGRNAQRKSKIQRRI